MKDCVEKQTLMHFIDRSKNLFFGRLDDPEIKERILEILEDILQNILVISMKCVDDIDLATTWQNSHGNVDEFLIIVQWITLATLPLILKHPDIR